MGNSLVVYVTCFILGRSLGLRRFLNGLVKGSVKQGTKTINFTQICNYSHVYLKLCDETLFHTIYITTLNPWALAQGYIGNFVMNALGPEYILAPKKGRANLAPLGYQNLI